MPRAVPLLLAAACVAFSAAPSLAVAAAPLPEQGVYDWCAPASSADRCASRVDRLAGAGFRVVQNASALGGDPALSDILAYADAAQARNVKVIWPLHALHAGAKGALPKVAAECGCQDDDAVLAYLVGRLRAHPATWGYYIVDEPTPQDHDPVAAFAAKVKALDPDHQRLIMGCGNCFGGERSVSFVSDVDATLGTDVYPVWEQAPDQRVVANKVRAAAAGLRRVADRARRKTVVALQAWRWGDSHYDSEATGIGQTSRFPTRREIEDQRNAAIAGGHPDLILWFTLNQVIGWEPGQRPWYWAEPGDAGQRWSNLVGGAFAPAPRNANRRPVARFTLRSRRGARRSVVVANASRSYDPDGRIVRYRWYASGKRRPVCSRSRCSMGVRQGRRPALRLVVTDSRGATASQHRATSPNARS